MVGSAITNALAFSGSNFIFSQMSSAEERKRHNLTMEKLQHERDTLNEQRLGSTRKTCSGSLNNHLRFT